MEAKKEDIIKAHENGCSDVKKVLETMFPKAFEKKEREYNENYYYGLHGASGKYVFTRIESDVWQPVNIRKDCYYDVRANTLKRVCEMCKGYEILEFKTYKELLAWLS